MFRPMTADAKLAISLQVDGQNIRARAGETLAMAMLNADVVPFRNTPISGDPRSPLCLMGVCFECLVEVGAQQNMQACMIEVRDGMVVRLQKKARQVREIK